MEAARSLELVNPPSYPAQLDPVEVARRAITRLREAGVSPVIPVSEKLTAPSPALPESRLDPRRAFVDFDLARQRHPDVFRAKYNDQKDRPMLRKMVQAFRDDPGIETRIEDTYHNPKKPRAGKLEATDDPYTDLLQKAASYRLLSAQEEVEIARNMKIGVAAYKKLQKTRSDDELLKGLAREGAFCKQAFYKLNIRLAAAPARNHISQYKHMTIADGLHYGLLGLQSAIEKFDESKGFKFSTYATWWIKQSIQRSIADEGRMIRLPIHVEEDRKRMYTLKRSMEAEIGREATRDELMELTGISEERMTAIENYGSYNMASLNKGLGDDSDYEVGDLQVDHSQNMDNNINGISAQQQLQNIVGNANLSQEELLVLSVMNNVKIQALENTSWYDGRTYEEIFDAVSHSNTKDYKEVGDALGGLSFRKVQALEEQVIHLVRVANQIY